MCHKKDAVLSNIVLSYLDGELVLIQEVVKEIVKSPKCIDILCINNNVLMCCKLSLLIVLNFES